MKNKVSSIVLGVLAFVSSVVGVYFLLFNNDENLLVEEKENEKEKENKNEILYRFSYEDGYIPGSEYDISIYDDRLEVDVTRFCSALDCESIKEDTEVIKLSKDNMNKLKKFVSEELNLDKKVKNEIFLGNLSEYQQDVLTSLTLDEYLFEVAVEDYDYKFSYGGSMNKEYHFYFKDDESILVKVLNSNDDYDVVGVDTYSIEFSKDNMDLLFDYAKKLTEDNNGSSYHKSGVIYKNEENIYYSLIENDESYLERDEVSLVYELNYNGVNCHTPYIRLYSDSSYEYYYTFTTDNKVPTPKKGTYDFDIESIINSVDLYEENERGPFVIKKANDKSYITYDTNVFLNDFLTKYELNLQMCVVQEY